MSELGPDTDGAGWELASAYVDDDVDTVARAQVDSSPALLAMVNELRQLHDSLATPPAVPRIARESAIAAALGAFDAGDGTSNPAASPHVAPDMVGARPHADAATSGSATTVRAVVHDLGTSRRRRQFTWITGAAAAAIAVVVSVVALRGGTGSDTKFSTGKEAAATIFSETAGGGDSPAAVTSPAAAASNQAAATTAATAAPDGTGSGGAGAPPVVAPNIVVALTSPDELLDLPRPEVATASAADTGASAGSSASTVAAAGTTAAPSPRCVQSPAVLLAVIDYRRVAAIAVVDDARHVREAIRSSDCVVLAEVADRP